MVERLSDEIRQQCLDDSWWQIYWFVLFHCLCFCVGSMYCKGLSCIISVGVRAAVFGAFTITLGLCTDEYMQPGEQGLCSPLALVQWHWLALTGRFKLPIVYFVCEWPSVSMHDGPSTLPAALSKTAEFASKLPFWELRNVQAWITYKQESV